MKKRSTHVAYIEVRVPKDVTVTYITDQGWGDTLMHIEARSDESLLAAETEIARFMDSVIREVAAP